MNKEKTVAPAAAVRASTREPGRLAQPTDEYDADYVWLKRRNGVVSFFFAKGDAGRDSLVSRVEVRYAPDAFLEHFWRNSRAFDEELRSSLAAHPFANLYEREHKRPEGVAPLKQQSRWANLDHISRHFLEATIDFYHVEPSSALHPRRRRTGVPKDARAVLRINISSFELLRLFEAAAPLAEEYEGLLRGMPQDLEVSQEQAVLI